MSPEMREYRYPWPASRLDEATMKLLYKAREKLAKEGIRKPITILIKEAVEDAYRKRSKDKDTVIQCQ